MNRLKWLVVFLVIAVPSYAQHFTLVEDTVRINASDYISPASEFEMMWAARYHDFYFCIFEDQKIYENWIRKNRLLVISGDGKEIVEVSLPKDFRGNYHGDLFVRHDTLYLRPYHTNKQQSGYYFDMDAWQWKPLDVVSNVIYDDDRYSVAYIDIGEWGEYTWFIEKTSSYVDVRYHTPQISSDIKETPTSVIAKPNHPEFEETIRQYIIPGNLSRIIKKDNAYYFIRGGKVDTLTSLNGKAILCKKGITYEEAAADHHAFLGNLFSLSGNLKFDPVPTFFHFTGREATMEDEDFWFEPRAYDTVFSNAFLTNGNLFYLMNTKKKTYIAQIEDGKLLEKFDLRHRYHFFQGSDCFRGKNAAHNQCLEVFKENKNSYGVLEIKDTIIHICHIIHNQDSLPHIGTDHIEPLLQYLLNHFDRLSLAHIDSVENVLQATCDGEFRELANHYFPDEYQTGEYEKYSYYTVIDSKKTLSVDYCVYRSDSIVCGAFFDWLQTNCYNSTTRYSGSMDNFEKKVAEVRQILTRLTGKEPVKITDKSTYLMWTYHNLTIELYEHGRMVMYLTGK